MKFIWHEQLPKGVEITHTRTFKSVYEYGKFLDKMIKKESKCLPTKNSAEMCINQKLQQS
jgi:hypothetical protein